MKKESKARHRRPARMIFRERFRSQNGRPDTLCVTGRKHEMRRYLVVHIHPSRADHKPPLAFSRLPLRRRDGLRVYVAVGSGRGRGAVAVAVDVVRIDRVRTRVRFLVNGL